MSQFEKLIEKYTTYYQTKYPYYQIYQWLSYNNTVDPKKREWSYEALTSDSEKYIKRFEVVKDEMELHTLSTPTNFNVKLKFDIGPVYKQDMESRKRQPLIPHWREFVFDIDADDFKTVRRCCEGKKMCNKCWRFMECAMCILIHFCQVFGFEKYMFVFSGRRGMHCWIVDEDARMLTATQRLQLLKQFELIKIDNEKEILIDFYGNSPICNAIFTICEKFFEIIKNEQGWFNEHYEATLQVIAKIAYDPKKPFALPAAVKNEETLLNYLKKNYIQVYKKLIIYFVYPRFDINVTRSMNHLLKVPFSVHAETTNISIPINCQEVVQFYQLDDFIRFPIQYQKMCYRFQVENPIKIDGDITEVVEWFQKYFVSIL